LSGKDAARSQCTRFEEDPGADNKRNLTKWIFYMVRLRVCGGNSKKNFTHKCGSDLKYDFLFTLCGNGRMLLLPKPKNESYLTLNHDCDKFEVGGA
jgi:hypothetical protein